MSCKICYKGEIRRLAKQPQDFNELLKTVKDTFVSGLPSKFTLEYQDAEGDKIIIHNDEDYKLALQSELSSKSLKIFLNDASELENVSFIAKESIEDPVPQQEQNKLTESDAKSFEVLTEVKDEVAVEYRQLTVEIPSTRSQTVVEQSSQIPSAEDLLGSGITVMSIHSGERKKKADKKVAWMREVAQETILERIPEIFTVFKEFLEESQVRKSQKSGAVHHGVGCDGCGTFPVVGNRFKCTVLDNFDLCEECESVVNHPYPLVKIVNEAQSNYVRNFFAAKQAVVCQQKQSKKCQKKQKKNKSKCIVNELLEHFEGINVKDAEKVVKQASEIVNDFDDSEIEELVAEAKKKEIRKHKKTVKNDAIVEDVITDVLQQLGGDASENIEYLVEVANTFAGEFNVAYEELAQDVEVSTQETEIVQEEVVSPSKKVSSKVVKQSVKDLAEIFPQAEYEEIYDFVCNAPHKAFEDLVCDFVMAY